MRTLSEFALIAQQGNNAYENGRVVGQITAYVLFAAIVLWVLGKVFRRR